jgi:hypothetical protein
MHYCARVLFRRAGETAASIGPSLRTIVQAASWSTIFLVSLASCRGSSGSTSDGAGGAPPSASGGAAGGPGSGSWSCSTTLGICSCVELGAEIQKRDECPRSSCCFESGPGRCNCVVDGGALGCEELGKALGKTKAVERCP